MASSRSAASAMPGSRGGTRSSRFRSGDRLPGCRAPRRPGRTRRGLVRGSRCPRHRGGVAPCRHGGRPPTRRYPANTARAAWSSGASSGVRGYQVGRYLRFRERHVKEWLWTRRRDQSWPASSSATAGDWDDCPHPWIVRHRTSRGPVEQAAGSPGRRCRGRVTFRGADAALAWRPVGVCCFIGCGKVDHAQQAKQRAVVRRIPGIPQARISGGLRRI
jgi:hypothetical protein